MHLIRFFSTTVRRVGKSWPRQRPLPFYQPQIFLSPISSSVDLRKFRGELRAKYPCLKLHFSCQELDRISGGIFFGVDPKNFQTELGSGDGIVFFNKDSYPEETEEKIVSIYNALVQAQKPILMVGESFFGRALLPTTYSELTITNNEEVGCLHTQEFINKIIANYRKMRDEEEEAAIVRGLSLV